MKSRTEILLVMLAGASIFAIAATDPWFIDNWLRIAIVAILLICAATVGFMCGVSHGLSILDKARAGK